MFLSLVEVPLKRELQICLISIRDPFDYKCLAGLDNYSISSSYRILFNLFSTEVLELSVK